MKKQIYKKFAEQFKFNIVNTDLNPNMKDSEKMNNCKIAITNRATNKKATFPYSQGLGITDLSDESRIIGLISCLISDRIYIDLEEFDGLGYSRKEVVKVYKSICKNNADAESIGLNAFLDSLTEEEKETLQ